MDDALIDLAQRLLDHGEPDSRELLAFKADFDDEALMGAADAARRRSEEEVGKSKARWAATAELLESAGVVALRDVAARASSGHVDAGGESPRPMYPFVSVNFDWVASQVDDPKDPEQFVTMLLRAAGAAMQVAGLGHEFMELKTEAVRGLESGEYQPVDVLDLVEAYIQIR